MLWAGAGLGRSLDEPENVGCARVGLRGFAGFRRQVLRGWGLVFVLLGAARGSGLRCVLVLALGVISLDLLLTQQTGRWRTWLFVCAFYRSRSAYAGAAASRKKGLRAGGVAVLLLLWLGYCGRRGRSRDMLKPLFFSRIFPRLAGDAPRQHAWMKLGLAALPCWRRAA